MYRRILPLMIFSFIAITHADYATQTDWFDGPGVWGPSDEWDNTFYLETRIEWDSIPGEISLQYDLDYLVAGYYNGASSVYSEDIDGDGDMDVIGAAAYDDEITWWENEGGSGTYWIEHIVDEDFQNARSVFAGDIDGDGDLDILSASVDDNYIMWWENIDGSGTSWTKHLVDNYFEYPRCIYSEDIDGDGDMDVLGAAYDINNITWWENENGSGTSWVKHTVDANFLSAHSVFAEDIDDDGYMDIIGGGAGGGGYSAWWKNVDGSGTSWIKHIIAGGVRSICAVDINGDCYMDILGATASNAIMWWENEDGSGRSWIGHYICTFYDDAISVYYEDLDSDGDIDVLGASYEDEITWWANTDTGLGIDWVEHIIDAKFNGAYSVYSQDINGDGEMDVLGAAINSDKIVWWDLNKYSLDGSLESSCLYLSSDPGWGSISWTTTEPSGTSVAFLVRSCDSPDSNSMGAWSDTLYSPCSLNGILDEDDSFFQYKVILETFDSSITPVLEDVTITWNPLGIEGGEPVVLRLLPFAPNPSSDSPVIRFSLPEQASVELRVFDFSGRLVNEIHGDEYSGGFHDVLLEDLSPGIYFCRMISGEFTATKRFVVIE